MKNNAIIIIVDFCTSCARNLVCIRLERDVAVAVAEAALTGEEMSAPAQHNRPWHLLAMDFASFTTMHGIRFLVEPTKFLTRRFAVTQLLHCRRFAAKEHSYVVANIAAFFYK